ncbi:MAG: lipopolysaccharide biosynthesis protein [Deltaproteobacteria bacterium]|nr:lipopolysaccharide biosynthesis protein [Deltaproteobacteria bacterium]
MGRLVSIYVVMGALRRLVSLFLVPLYTRLIPQADYGRLDLLIAAAGFLGLLADFHLDLALSRFFYPEAEKGNARAYLGSCLATRVLLSAAVLGVGVLLSDQTASWVVPGAGGAPSVFALLMATLLIVDLESMLLLCLRLRERVMAFSVLSVIDTLVQTATAVVVVGLLDAGMIGIVWAQLAGAAVGAAGALVLLRGEIEIAFSWPTVRQLLAFSAPMVPGSLFAWAGMYLNRIIVSRHVSLDDVARLALAMKFVGVVQFLGTSVRLAWTPLSMRVMGDLAGRNRFYRTGLELLVAAMLVVCTALTLLSRPLVALLAPDGYAAAAHFVPLMVLGAMFATSTIFVDVGNQIARSTYNSSISTVAGTAVNLAILVVAVPKWGLYAAAVGFFAGNLTNVALLLLLTGRRYRVGYRPGMLGATLAGAAVLLAYQPVGSRLAFGSGAWILASLAAAFLVAIASWYTLAPSVRRSLPGILRLIVHRAP